MKKIQFIIVTALCLFTAFDAFAQRGGGGVEGANDDFIPDAIYEVRYWTNMAAYDGRVEIDTMVFQGGDRAVFEYSNKHCVSYGCRQTDSLIYVMLPKMGASQQKEWTMGEFFLRKVCRVTAPFRGFDRSVYKLYATDVASKDTGLGEYAFVTREFGVIYRYNSSGEQYMLNRIDVIRNGQVKDEINLLPLQKTLAERTSIYSCIE